MKKAELKPYIRKHWKSLYLQAFGFFVVLLFLIFGSFIMMDKIPNPFTFNLVTFLVLCLAGAWEMEYFFKMAKEVKEKETD